MKMEEEINKVESNSRKCISEIQNCLDNFDDNVRMASLMWLLILEIRAQFPMPGQRYKISKKFLAEIRDSIMADEEED
jgi:hypothetical protein